ncbi:MAG: hypothetical protein U0736_24690 [Gemmataceae bacterium]
MLRHLTRTAFIDSIWGAGELNEAADFWVRGCTRRRRRDGSAGSPTTPSRCGCRGSRGTRPRRCATFAARLKDGDFPDPRLTLANPDTVVFTSGYTPSHRAPIEGLVVPLLAGAPVRRGCWSSCGFTVAAFRKERSRRRRRGFGSPPLPADRPVEGGGHARPGRRVA